jgi:hypothetical protein
MLITVINDSGGNVRDDDLLRAIRAVNRQIDHDFRPYWHLTGELRLGGRRGKLAHEDFLDTRGDAIIYVQAAGQKPDDIDEGIAGYHDKKDNGVPVAYIFTNSATQDWALTLSHEALELVAHPLVNLYAHGPHPDPTVYEKEGRLVFHAYEVCDAVQAEYYEVDGLKVSNFLLPLYFTVRGDGRGRVVFQGRDDVKPLRSFGLNPGGYIPFYDPQDRKYYHYYLSRDPQKGLVGNYREERRMAHYYSGFPKRHGSVEKTRGKPPRPNPALQM